MKSYLLSTLVCIGLLYIVPNVAAQKNYFLPKGEDKRLIDSSVYLSWPRLDAPQISDDGLYCSYAVSDADETQRRIEILSSDKKWHVSVSNADYTMFSDDSKFAFILKRNDTLLVVKLGTLQSTQFVNIGPFGLLKGKKNNYIVFNKGTNLVLYDFYHNRRLTYESILGFRVSGDQKVLVMIKDINNTHLTSLERFNVDTKQTVSIWKGDSLGEVAMDGSGSQVVFSVIDSVNRKQRISCFYNRVESVKSEKLFDSQSIGLKDSTQLSDFTFSRDGNLIYFSVDSVIQRHVKSPSPGNLRIWSYQDRKLQSVQSDDSAQKHVSLQRIYNINTKRIYSFQQPGEIVLSRSADNKLLLLHRDSDADLSEISWNSEANFEYYLVIGANGTRKRIEKPSKFSSAVLSPSGKFILFCDMTNYFSYEIESGKYRNLTGKINVDWSKYSYNDRSPAPRKALGWAIHDEMVFLYDRYDIWIIDPLGKKEPINITNGFGKRHNIIFTLAMNLYDGKTISLNDKLVLNAISLFTKENGFFIKDLLKTGDPELLTMGSDAYDLTSLFYVREAGRPPVKAKKSNEYIVTRMSAHEFPNLFLTKDFKEFVPLSDLHPEKEFNWYTTELHTWKSLDGSMLQGVLYKPDNFDSTKKYPVIFNYYEKMSFNLNAYLPPWYSQDNINIPTYVSNGYLVFTPDIDYKMNDAMQGTYNSLVSAGRYLSRLPFVDSSRMGIQGFSYGGIETNYLVANTNMFAAACAGSGMSDLISAYGTITKSGMSIQDKFEYGGQYRINGAPWELTNEYIKNSPIFRANKITTPLLIMHTTNDGGVPFSQAVELFMALRKLGKRVWLLEYTDGNHGLTRSSGIDFDTRMMQFFNHYLKGEGAPVWMTQDLSAGNKQFKNALQLDPATKTPGASVLTDTSEKDTSVLTGDR